MVNKDANFPPKKTGYQDDPTSNPDREIQKIEGEMLALKQQFREQLEAIQNEVQLMLSHPGKLNIAYLMLMLTDVSDIQTTMGAEPLKLATKLKDLFTQISKSLNNQIPTADLKAGGRVVINGTTYTLSNPPLSSDGKSLNVQESQTPIALFTYDSSGNVTGLAPGVPFFKLSDLGLTFTGSPQDPPPPGLQASGGSPAYNNTFANNMIAAGYADHTAQLGNLDQFRDAMKKYENWLHPQDVGPLDTSSFPDIQSLIDNTTDLIGNYAPLGSAPYTYEASTGALQGVSTSDVESCSQGLTDMNASKNAMETALNSTVSQNQIELNQAEGQYQSAMQAIGGAISQFKDQINSWISNMRS